MESKVRNLQPYRLSNTRGYWYLIGNDLDRGALRTFRVDRINSTVSTSGRSGAYEIDQTLLEAEEAKYSAQLKSAVVAIRKGKAQSLRTGAIISEKNADWDLCTVQYRSDENLLQRVLWYGTDAVIEEPQYLRDELVSRLEKAVLLHG
jgi:proteasome accessory factor B